MAKFLGSVLAVAAVAVSQHCPLQYDGRVPNSAALSLFDSSGSPYNTQYDLGSGLKWSGVLSFPDVNSSLFDGNRTKAIEVSINSQSIFQSQTGFRRAELLPASNSGTDPSTSGIKTTHFSLMKDLAHPLNTSHEYQLFFLESSDYSTNQVALKYGTILGGNPSGVSPDSLMLFGNVNSKPIPLLFHTPFTAGVWHNFGVAIDFGAGTTKIYYSTGNTPLASVSAAVKNVVSGQGEYHYGILKKPVNPGSDVTKSGYQEPIPHGEGVIFGGIFEENSSSAGCISLQP